MIAPIPISRDDAFQAMSWEDISAPRFAEEQCVYCGHRFQRSLLGHDNCPNCFDDDIAEIVEYE